jgi:hypothetical protein
VWRNREMKIFQVLTFSYNEVKAQVLPLHDTKGRGSRGMAPLILKLGTRWKWVNFTPRPHYSREIRRCPSNWRLGGRQNRSGRFGKENSLSLMRFKPRTLQPIAGGYTDLATPAPSLIIRPVKVTLRKTIEDKCSQLKVIIKILKHVYKRMNIYDTTFIQKHLTLIPQFRERASP